MKNLKTHLLISFVLFANLVSGQEEESSSDLQLSGSVDTYFKSDFSGHGNIGTSFADDNNSFSIGMFNLIATKSIGKASFVADIGVGPRNASSVPSGSVVDIQNLYFSYALSGRISIVAGYMGTFVGYEVISPTGNFNYSTSYLFTNGPFQNAGVKFEFTISEKVTLMTGIFNDWNVYKQPVGESITSLGAQLALRPADDLDLYINAVSGAENGYELDFTSGLQVSEKFYLGLNAATWSYKMDETTTGSFAGAAIYAQYSLRDNLSFGLRGEQFSTENTGYIGVDANDVEAKSVSAITLSANLGSGALKFIPEVRFDSASKKVFSDSNDSPTNNAAQFLIAAIFEF